MPLQKWWQASTLAIRWFQPIDRLTEGLPLWVEGELLADGQSLNAVGWLLAFVVRDRNRHAVSAGADVKLEWVNAAKGQFRVRLGFKALKADGSPYDVRLALTDGRGRAVTFPSGAPDRYVVTR